MHKNRFASHVPIYVGGARSTRLSQTVLHEEEKPERLGQGIIATARKFLGIIYKALKNKWVFEAFPNFVLAEG
jgi:hypothetical protein